MSGLYLASGYGGKGAGCGGRGEPTMANFSLPNKVKLMANFGGGYTLNFLCGFQSAV